jgi:hypothetical protein
LLKILVWLTIDEVIDESAKNVQLTLTDFDEVQVFAANVSTQVTAFPGVFKYEYETDLDPDQIYILTADITDFEDGTHTAYCGIISLD